MEGLLHAYKKNFNLEICLRPFPIPSRTLVVSLRPFSNASRKLIKINKLKSFPQNIKEIP
jgi:hypothetical protein